MGWLLPPDWNVPELFTSRLGDAAGRQRAMAADEHLLIVLHQPPSAGMPERRGRAFWRDPEATWRSSNLGDGPQALRKHLAEFTERVDALEKQWQSAASADDYFQLLQAIGPLHRTARNLHATLQQARELLPDDRDLINLRDQAGEVERTLELLHADAKNGLDFTIAHQAEQQAQRSYDMAVAAHRLNLLAAAFFPIATLGAIFGMNLMHGLNEWNSPAIFWGILLIGLVCGLMLAWVVSTKPAPIAPPAVRPKRKRR